MSGLAVLLGRSLRRLGAKPARAILSIAGIAVGVALALSVQVINANLTGSSARLERELAGRADVEVVARLPQGVHQHALAGVEALPEVAAAAPVREGEVVLTTSRARAEVRLVGLDERAARLAGPTAKAPEPWMLGPSGLGLSRSVADELSVGPGDTVIVESAGRRRRVVVSGRLDPTALPSLARGPIAFGPLDLVQDVTGAPSRVNRMLVAFQPGSESRGRRRLERLVEPELDVRAVGSETRLLEHASSSNRSVAAGFSVVSLVVGGLLVYNAMLLTVLERRREMAVMRALGAPTATLIGALLIEALILGTVATGIGVALGLGIVTRVVEHTPGYLEEAFVLGREMRVPASVLVFSCAAGIASTVAAALMATLAMLRVPPTAAMRDDDLSLGVGEGGRPRGRARTALGVGALGAGAAFASALPQHGLAGIGLFLAGAMLLLPRLVVPATRLARRAARSGPPALQMASAELVAMPGRAGTVTAIAAITVTVLVMIGGSVRNLETGAQNLAQASFRHADLWASAQLRHNDFFTAPFPHARMERIRRLPGVARVTPYRSAFLDWHGRRLLAFGYEPNHHDLSATELVAGDPRRASRLLAAGRGALLTRALAHDLGLRVGDRLDVPTPSGIRHYVLAGLITNYGWRPGALALSAQRFARDWRSSDVTAAEITLVSGAAPAATAAAVRRSLRGSGLRVESGVEAQRRLAAVGRQGVSQLSRIAAVVALAAMLALSAAMTTAVAQRQRRLAALRAVGLSRLQGYATLLAEAALILAIGTAIGLVFGVAAQAFTVRWIQSTTGYPAPFEIVPAQLLVVVATSAATAIVAGTVAARHAVRRAIVAGLAYE